MNTLFDGEDSANIQAFNQSSPLADYNLFATNASLVAAIKRYDASWAVDELSRFGAYLGSAETIELASLANNHSPVLHAFDRFGNRIDEVEFHPSWHHLMNAAVAVGIHSSPWSDAKQGAHVARAAACMMQTEIECGVQCPTTMTYGSVPTIRQNARLAETWLPKIYSRSYDPRFLPVTEKSGALIGMGMTEKQGGSDVRTNVTKAELIESGSNRYVLEGHKWFFSAPMCDAFMVTAQAKGGISCFFVPRWLPDNKKNAIRIQRLKDKLGNRSNASSEVEFHGAQGWLIGEEGRGIPTIIEMATYTRLDCALGSTGLMHQAVAQAVHHAGMRTAFGRLLIDQPLMKNVLADLILEVEGATALAMRIAHAFDRQDDPEEGRFRRIVTPAVKYWICKRGASVSVEAMEVLGGNGYVEEGTMARIYREMPLNSIWEGSGNVMCLDVLRALRKDPAAIEIVFSEWREARGGNHHLDKYANDLESDIGKLTDNEMVARQITERLSLCLSGALLVRHAPHEVSEAFCASRLSGTWGSTFGTLPTSCNFAAIIDRGRTKHH
jgi:putative acyl-CoA dehydrogenase